MSYWEAVCQVSANENATDLHRCADRYLFRIRRADGTLHAPGEYVVGVGGTLLRQPAWPLPHPSRHVRSAALSCDQP